MVNHIHTLVDLSGDRRLIVDYQGMPIEWCEGDTVPQPKTNHFDRLGESDVKFVLYLEPGMPFLADSVDGGTTHSHEAFVHVANTCFACLS